MKRRTFSKTVTLVAALTFASTSVMLADLYSPGPNTTDLQGQWIDATTSPPGGPPVYGTPGAADDVDLQGFDITASGGTVRSIYNVGNLTVTGMASTQQASEFTLRGSGTLNIDHVGPNIGFAVVSGHLKASGAADFVGVSSGGVVTAATCKGGSFEGGSSLTLTGTGGTGGSANFFSASSLTAKAGLRDFSFTLNSASLAHIASYTVSTSGSVYINDAGSALTVDQVYSINSGNLNIAGGGSATITGPMLLSGGQVSLVGSGSKLNVTLNIQINGGDLQMSNGGIGTVPELQLPHGHASVRDAGSVLKVDKFTIGGDPNNAPATVDVAAAGEIQKAGGAESKITVTNNGVLNVQDNSSEVSAGELLIHGGTVNLNSFSEAKVTVGQVESGTQRGRLTISGGLLNALSFFVRDGSIVDVNNGGGLGSNFLSLAGQFSVSGGSIIAFKEVTVSSPSTLPGSQLHATDGGTIEIDSILKVYSGVVSVLSNGAIDIGVFKDVAAKEGEIRVHAGGALNDDGAVIGNVINVLNQGSISGTGTINGRLISSGRTGPGNSPGVLTVQGDFTQNSDGLLSMEIGGTDAGTGYDQLQVSGTATIAGSLQVRLMNGFTPTVGQTYRIVNAGSFSGGFSSITQPSQAGISVANDATGLTVTITSVVAGAPVISSATTVSATQGAAFSYQIAATNNPTSFGAMNLPDGLTVNQSTGVISGTPTKSGTYVVPIAANNTAGSGLADLIIEVAAASGVTPGLVANVSTRLPVGQDPNALFQGFIVQGPAGSTKKILVRALGPFLGAFGITDFLANPTLDIFDGSNTKVASNDNWKTTQVGGLITGDQFAEINASGLAPTNDLESAIIANLAPGQYTAVVHGSGNSVGTGLVDAFDISAVSPARLVNVGTRGLVQPGDGLLTAG
ncbi:MAG: hypothetical protein DLM73_13330, partial [Chthoniobacterales bacterium]